MSNQNSDFLAAVLAELGPSGVVTTPEQMQPFLTDWRGVTGHTHAVLQPSSTQDVARIMQLARDRGVRLTPQGGNTGLVDGGLPHGEVLVSLRRMTACRFVDPANDAMILEAGVTLTQAQDIAAAHDRLFPLALGAQDSATIGGLVGTNAGGVQVVRYGMMRDLVLGLEVVLPNGQVLDVLRTLRKDNTGYDLKQLFIGAEGTLGIVTAAALKLYARPAAQPTAFVALGSPKAAIELLSLAKARSGSQVTGFELMPRLGLELVARHIPNTRLPLALEAPWYVLLEISCGRAEGATELMEDLLVEATEAGFILDAAIAPHETARKAFWRIRETLPMAEKAAGAHHSHDVSVPISAIPDYIARATPSVLAIAPEGVAMCIFGHLGDGNLHANVLVGAADIDVFRETKPQIAAAIHELACQYGGSISAEHGIGRLKRDEMARRKSPAELDLMRALKAAIDPQNILNPGRIVSMGEPPAC